MEYHPYWWNCYWTNIFFLLKYSQFSRHSPPQPTLHQWHITLQAAIYFCSFINDENSFLSLGLFKKKLIWRVHVGLPVSGRGHCGHSWRSDTCLACLWPATSLRLKRKKLQSLIDFVRACGRHMWILVAPVTCERTVQEKYIRFPAAVNISCRLEVCHFTAGDKIRTLPWLRWLYLGGQHRIVQAQRLQ